MTEALTFLLQTLGLGLLTGFVFGFLFKKVVKIILFFTAMIIVAVIILGHNGILEIGWLSTKDLFHEFSSQHLDCYSDRLLLFMRNIPFVIGIILGGLYGLRKG